MNLAFRSALADIGLWISVVAVVSVVTYRPLMLDVAPKEMVPADAVQQQAGTVDLVSLLLSYVP